MDLIAVYGMTAEPAFAALAAFAVIATVPAVSAGSAFAAVYNDIITVNKQHVGLYRIATDAAFAAFAAVARRRRNAVLSAIANTSVDRAVIRRELERAVRHFHSGLSAIRAQPEIDEFDLQLRIILSYDYIHTVFEVGFGVDRQISSIGADPNKTTD